MFMLSNTLGYMFKNSPIHVQPNMSNNNYPKHILQLFTFYLISKWHFKMRICTFLYTFFGCRCHVRLHFNDIIDVSKYPKHSRGGRKARGRQTNKQNDSILLQQSIAAFRISFLHLMFVSLLVSLLIFVPIEFFSPTSSLYCPWRVDNLNLSSTPTAIGQREIFNAPHLLNNKTF